MEEESLLGQRGKGGGGGWEQQMVTFVMFCFYSPNKSKTQSNYAAPI